VQEAKFDPRLMHQMRRARDHETVEAIVLVGHPDEHHKPDDRSLAERIVEAVSREIGERPTSIRNLPRTNTLVVESSPAFLAALAEQDEVRYLSATTVDFL
jgi:hypothetical protein